jgi:hypothetical protein
MHRPAVVIAAITAATVAGLAATAGTDERALAFTLDVRAPLPVAVVEPAGEACQAGVQSESRFDVVRFLVGTYGRPGPELAVAVRDTAGGRPLATGTLPAGARDNQPASVRLAPAVAEGRRLDICIRNKGAQRVALYGAARSPEPLSAARVGERPLRQDLRLDFYRSEPRSALSLVPDMFARAALFRPQGIGSWTYWCLLAVTAAGIPLLLGAAVRRALAEAAHDAPGGH